MTIMNENAFAEHIGRSVNHKQLDRLARKNLNSYLIYNDRYMDDPMYIDLFGLTERILRKWDYDGIQFQIELSIDDMGSITQCSVFKYREGQGGHFRPNIVELKPTQQEFRIARRVIEYICGPEKEE